MGGGSPAPPAPGLATVDVSGQRAGLVYSPDAPAAERRRLVVVLHGAGGSAEQGLALLRPFADQASLVLLAPQSLAPSWDVLYGGYGPDVARIDAALAQVLAAQPVAPGDVAVGGFSDGASYALSLGLTNGDLFSAVLAFSPGFTAPGAQQGEPRLYLSHGVHDEVLPVDRCSRRLVPALRAAGYSMTYREFDGPHVVPPEIAREAVSWLTDEPVELPRGTPTRRPGN